MKVLLPNFEKRGGLVPVIVQDYWTRRVLMLAYTDKAGYLETLSTGEAVYFSTSRQSRWKKGDTSGCAQIVHQVLVDCDRDALVFMVVQLGGRACHTRAETCFYRDCVNHQLFSAPEGEVLEDWQFADCEVVPRLQKQKF